MLVPTCGCLNAVHVSCVMRKEIKSALEIEKVCPVKWISVNFLIQQLNQGGSTLIQWSLKQRFRGPLQTWKKQKTIQASTGP